MQIIKRDGRYEPYRPEKIETAIQKAFESVQEIVTNSTLSQLTKQVEDKINHLIDQISVELIQDLVETTLMEQGYYHVSKSYILYRSEHAKRRVARQHISAQLDQYLELPSILKGIQLDYRADVYSLSLLENKFLSFQKLHMTPLEKMESLIKASIELTTQDAPGWEKIATRLMLLKFEYQLRQTLKEHNIKTFSQKVMYLTKQHLYGDYILAHYTPQELEQAAKLLDDQRNYLLTYSGLHLLLTRYIIKNHTGQAFETPQEMFLGIALHLAIPEKHDRFGWIKRFYDMLSTLKVTMATPTLSNARKPFHQLSSCFIDTVPDSLTGIYRSIDNFAQVSKYGGGMGLYFGKIRATGSTIRGFQGAAGGVIRWIKLANDTAVAVDQLGVRQGAVAIYLDVWHKDLPEFLSLRTNNGDDRLKAHDIFPAICYPDLFWKMARDHLEENWFLMCPHEILTVKGYALEDSYGEEWEKKYQECVADEKISKRIVPIKDIVRLILKSSIETGSPFAFNRDTVNRTNPNAHKGIIYCSNLCTEIAQNMSSIESVSQTIQTEDGDPVVVTVTKPGDFVVCNLASLSLGQIDLENSDELQQLVQSVVRALDNVIDLNLYPLPYAKITNHRYRPIGLGVSGYHHMLAKRNLAWEKEEHLQFVDKLFEKINYYAISASADIAIEKGCYEEFSGSDWHTGVYFDKRGYHQEHWIKLKEKVKETGLRNGWLLAIAPTSSTSIISATTPGIDPIMKRFFLEEKKNSLIPRVAPELNNQNFWYYKNAHLIDQTWSIRAAGIRQRHIDQSQSMNLYITNDFTFRQILQLYILAFEQGVKTIYYIRSKSLEVEECDVCSS